MSINGVINRKMKLLSVADVANKLGVSRGRINQFINEERLPAQKIGRSYVIQEKDLKRIASRKNGRPSKTRIKKYSSHKKDS